MKDYTLTRTAIRAGQYKGVLTTRARVEGTPELELVYLGSSVARVQVTPDAGRDRQWNVKVAIPPSSINEGVQTYLLRLVEGGEVLDSFAIATGTVLEGDFGAEIALLRAELELLKKAFRNHCAQG